MNPSRSADGEPCKSDSAEIQPRVNGQYCMVSFAFDTSTGIKTPVRLHLSRAIPIADFYHLLSGLCIPSSCDRSDLITMLNYTLPNYDLRLINVTHCDTRESISFKFSNLALIQKISYIFGIVSLVLVSIGTIFQLIGIDCLRSHSLIANFNALITTEGRNGRIGVADIFKTVFALYATAVHSIAAITTPTGTYMLARLVNVDSFVTKIWIQPFINVAGLNIISFLG